MSVRLGGDQRARGPLVAVVGSVNVDMVARVQAQPLPGETVLGTDLAVLPGGKGANQAVAAARLGARVALVGAVGEDGFAGRALDLLREADVDLSGVSTVPGPTGVALITVAATGENSIVVIPGANAHVDAEAVRARRETIAEASVVVLQGEIPADGVHAAARAATGRVLINLAPVIDLDPDVLRGADPLVVNEIEGSLVADRLGLVVGRTGERVTRPDDEEVVTALVRAGIPSVVMTRGAAGALVATPAGTKTVPSVRVQTVDTTGAGDAFVGALAHRLALGSDIEEAAAYAARVGAHAVLAPGAQPSYPWAHDRLPGEQA